MGALEGYEVLHQACGVLPDLGLALIELTGEDRLEWLQGQATNDLRGLEPGVRRSFCLCEATGQIVAVCDLWMHENRFLIVTDVDAAPAVMRRVETMVILEDVAARDLTPGYRLVSIQGAAALDAITADLPEAAFSLRSDRLSWPGYDVWVPKGTLWDLGLPVIDEASCEVARIEAGVPKRGVDYTSKTLPPELGPAFEARYVSYSKGCYMGQEVLMRIHSRGHTNKTWVGLALDAPVQAGEAVSSSEREDAGVITSAAVSPRLGPIAAAMLRNEAAAEGAEIKVGAAKGRVTPMPFAR
ncbi:MAG: hypothetical protein QOJ65_98 [Fimbriimonadaceae bacterium]|jgi:folate-binding protein YgfZ|nr:hypothetical protein [Fimbriimonadaceae bacterium]